MATPWNFSFSKIITPLKYNIRPTYTYTNLTVAPGSSLITGFSLAQLDNLKVGMKIYCSANELWSSREISAIDVIEKTVTYTGVPLALGQIATTFVFNSNPGALSTIETPLGGQQAHDNFFYLAEGLTNHQERLVTIEGLSKNTSESTSGYVFYNGYKEKKGSFYGGSKLNLVPSSDTTLGPLDSGNQKKFSVAIDAGISSPIANSKFYEIVLGADKTIGFTFSSVTDLCTYINTKLINNGNGFYIRSTFDMGGTFIQAPYTTSDWDVDTPGFYVRIDDAQDSDLIKFSFKEEDRPVSLAQLVNILNSKFQDKYIDSKIEAKIDTTSGFNKLEIFGKNSKTTGCTRFEIINLPSHSFIENVLRLEEKTVFDFSTTFSFTPYSATKLSITGLDPASQLSFKDDGVLPALQFLGFEAGQFLGASIVYHVAEPSSTDVFLNYDGVFISTGIKAKNATFETISANTFDIGLLTATTLESDDISINDALTVVGLSTLGATSATSLTVSGASTLTGGVTAGGTSEFGLVQFTKITEDFPAIDELVLYRANLLGAGPSYVLDTEKAPKAPTNGSEYLLYNGNFGSFNMDVMGTLKIHQVTATPREGCFYAGTVSPSASTRVNFNGNFYATSVNTTSSRTRKANIIKSEVDALQILLDTFIVNFNYKEDLTVPKIGFIAEDTNSLLATPTQDSMDITNCIGLLIKAVQQLDSKIEDIRKTYG